ncbi:hypothetical protein PDE_01708 [Penicillium oxalicum 114-2]|uniref:Uncharacterized protein n=1 Tax=Penicillium oxalicum (strain 114-2 / CGMCC 5302) TaxID=933388 RepID=S7Z981_PENO1|nr:hypothetical protein PDE_01708 [Penicillium oxalicum 114-2]
MAPTPLSTWIVTLYLPLHVWSSQPKPDSPTRHAQHIIDDTAVITSDTILSDYASLRQSYFSLSAAWFFPNTRIV